MIRRHEQDAIHDTFAQLQASVNRHLRMLTVTLSPAVIHETRISIRRLRVALRAMKHQLVRSLRKRNLVPLRQFACALEAIREADARESAAKELFERYVSITREQSRQVLAVVTEQRAHARRDLLRLMHTAAWKQRLAQVERCSRASNMILPLDTPVLVIRDVLARRHRRLRRALSHIGRSPRKLHRLRLRIKETRYLDEDFGSLLTMWPQRELRRLRQLQNRLGEFNDNWCLRKWLRSQYDHEPIANSLCAGVDTRQTQLLKTIARLGKSMSKSPTAISIAA